MTCTGNVDERGIEQRSASGGFEEWGPTGLSGSWQRGPFSAGTTKMYCTYYYVGGAKSHAGACITVTWQAEPPPCNNNYVCEPSRGENPSNCPTDCGCNNNDYCETQRGENQNNCDDCVPWPPPHLCPPDCPPPRYP
jgi:hypothetical protein